MTIPRYAHIPDNPIIEFKEPVHGREGPYYLRVKRLVKWLQGRARGGEQAAALALQNIHTSGLSDATQTSLEEWMAEETA